MRKRNKGFTLVELLAVIVILAIIAQIATPIILNVISDAKKEAAKDSAYGYIEAIENAIIMNDFDIKIVYSYIVHRNDKNHNMENKFRNKILKL